MRRVRRIADVMALLLLAGYAVPFFWQLLTSFKPDALLVHLPPLLPTQVTTAHYQAVWAKSVIPRALGNSLAVAGLTTLLALVLGLTAAYALVRFATSPRNWRKRRRSTGRGGGRSSGGSSCRWWRRGWPRSAS